MRIAIMQPYFFPYIGYFQLINAVDKFVLYDNVNFIKKGWVNSNRILLKNNGTIDITVPLKHSSSFVKIKDIKISEDVKWRARMNKVIRMNYAKAPMFENVFPLIERLINLNTTKISELNNAIIAQTCKYLNISTPLKFNSEQSNIIEDDLNNKYSSGNNDELDKKTARIFELCKSEGADTYINPIGGVDIYSKELFRKNGIELKFVKSSSICYEQFHNEFIPWLSIIDVMMFNPPESIGKMLDEFELI